ncbi:MAG: preprotein translocase subunit SecE [Lachnospiraceae bacterium]|nr:preprotein translocase subunit SecE [Lachnospiraceae bacterium]
MGETTGTEKAPKKSFFKGLKAEFKKIVWPDQETVAKQTAAVLAVSVALGAMIAVLDFIIKWGLSFIIK